MNYKKTNSAKGIFLLLITAALLFSSVGFHPVSGKVKHVAAKEKKSEKDAKSDEQVSVTPALEAIVVSVVNPDFAKCISFYSFDSAFPLPVEAIRSGNILFLKNISEPFSPILYPQTLPNTFRDSFYNAAKQPVNQLKSSVYLI